MANTYYTLFAVYRFFVISFLFRRCSWIVYSGLQVYQVALCHATYSGSKFVGQPLKYIDIVDL